MNLFTPKNRSLRFWLGASLSVIILIVILVKQRSRDELTATLNDSKLMKSEEKGPDTRPSEWAWLRRTYPYGQADLQAFRAEIHKAQQMQNHAQNVRLQSVEFAGPTNIGGRIIDIEFNPQDGNIVYAGAATGGVFKSTDAGVTWFPIFDEQAILTIGDIGIDPQNPDVIYVGTGEANGGHNNFAGGGIYKSTDGGVSWTFLGLEKTVSIGRIVVDPFNPQRVFVAAVGSYFGPNPERGVYRSTDGGQTWEQKLFVSDSTGAIDIILDPLNSRLMAAMWERVRPPEFGTHLFGPTSGIYRSNDGGDTWALLGPGSGLPDSNNRNIGRIGLTIHKANPNIVYALYNDGSNYVGFFKTTDFGNTWTNADPNGQIASGFFGFSWYFGQTRVHPTNPDILFVLDGLLMKSTSGGTSWFNSTSGSVHVDQHALAFHPTNPDYLILGNDGGMNISTNGGVSWSKVADLPVTQFYEIGLDSNNPERLYGGTQDNGTLRTLTGATDDWGRILGGDGFYVIVNHSNPNIIYAESQFGNLSKSTNGGSSFSGATNGITGKTNWSTPVVMDPDSGNVLYYGSDRVWRTTNNATTWTAISPVLHTVTPGSRLGTVTTIGVSPANRNIIWAGTDDSNVWVSNDFGANWTNVSDSLPNRWVTRVIPDPLEANTVYVTFNGLRWKEAEPKVFRTTDLGQTWENITGNLPDAPVNACAVYATANERLLFVGSDLGAYYSNDDGQNWQYLSSDLPMVSVYDLKIHETGNYLAIGTHARSMYTLDLAQITGIENDRPTPAIKSFELLQNFPNPFNPTTTIAFRISKNANVTLKIFDTVGRDVRTLVNGNKTPGTHQVEWDGKNQRGQSVASGTYFYRLEIDGANQPQMRKMLLIR